MQKYQNNVQTTNGAAIPGAIVLVTNYPSGTTATIYSDNGVTQTANPVIADSAGMFSFYAPDGHYSLQVGGSGVKPYTLTDVVLADPFASGTTAQRPTPTVVGQRYFDTTLGYFIEAQSLSPVVWVNAAGAQV